MLKIKHFCLLKVMQKRIEEDKKTQIAGRPGHAAVSPVRV